MNIKQSITLLVVLLGFIVNSYGQTNGVLPYSRLGIGEISPSHLSHIKSMGGTGIAYTDVYMINPNNPASYSYLKSSAFDIGLFAKRAKFSSGEESVNVWSGNINNLSLGFPMRNPINDILDRVNKKYHWGMAFHLLPYSVVGYDIKSTENNPGFGEYERYYNGKGGSYKFLWGNSIRYNDLSFGVHLGYLFGNITNNRRIIFKDNIAAYNDIYNSDYHVSGFVWDAGLMYTLKFNEKKLEENNEKDLNKLTFGLTISPATSFKTTTNILQFAGQSNTGLTDTIKYVKDEKGLGKLPLAIGFGVNYYAGNKWTIGVNYKTTQWSDFSNDANPTTFLNSSRMSLGGFYRPNVNSYSFFNRIIYQYGAYYENTPIIYGDEQIDSYGITLGMGLPFVFKRKISHANVGIDFGYKGQNSPIKETYLKINFGFIFNDDSWFLKRKYN